MQPYQHASLDLDPGSIRILTVLPQDTDQQVRCTIKHGDLDGSFSALSYTWGPPDSVNEILIDGRPFAVRQNLFDFLRMISEKRPGIQLWVDAICIDQINDSEKSHQVLQMGSIYAAAREVLVWLGGDKVLQDWFAAMQGRAWTDAPSEGVHMPIGRRAWLDGFRILMLHPYWTRLWITQELLLGRNAKLLAGNSSISLTFFKKQYDLYRLDARNLFDPNRVARVFPLLARKYQRDKRFTPHSLGVRAAFEMTADSVCHDPRDRIFGLVSLIEGGENFPLNYADSRFTVFLRAIVQFNDKYMSCALLELLDPRPESVHTDLRMLLQSEEDLSFHDVRLPRLEQVTSRSELCHRHLRDEVTAAAQRYIWCIELLPKVNWEDKYISHCCTLHIIFEIDQRSGVFRSVDSVCQRDINDQRSTVADQYASMVLSQAKRTIEEGAIFAARPLKVGPTQPDEEGEIVQVTFPLAILSQIFWYLLKPRIKQEIELDGIDLWDGIGIRTARLESNREQDEVRNEEPIISSVEDSTPEPRYQSTNLTLRVLKSGQKKLRNLIRSRDR